VKAQPRGREGFPGGSAEIEGHPIPSDDVNSLKRKFHNIINSTTPDDLNDRGRLVVEASLTIQSASLEEMVEDKVKGSLNIIDGKFKEVTDQMKNLDKKVSDEMKKSIDEMKKSIDDLKKENTDGLKKVSDKLEALPGIVKSAILAPQEMAGQLAEESVRDMLRNFPEGDILRTLDNPLEVGSFVAIFASDIPNDLPNDISTDFVADNADISRYDLMFQ
jgi:gas vesicle protein